MATKSRNMVETAEAMGIVEWRIFERIEKKLAGTLELEHEAQRRALRAVLEDVASHLRREGYDDEMASKALPEHLATVANALRNSWPNEPTILRRNPWSFSASRCASTRAWARSVTSRSAAQGHN